MTSTFDPGRSGLLIGMVHVLPLPGAPQWGGSMSAVLERAARDATALAEAGFDALLVENFGDAPFFPDVVPPETIAGLTVVASRVASVSALPMGVNVLRNDARAALGIAAVVGASFMRINLHTGALLTDQGWITGRAHETLRQRRQLDSAVAICADVLVKHATAPPGTDVAEVARDTYLRGGADVLIVSGPATGMATDPARARAVKQAVPEVPLWIGSGIRAENIASFLTVANGAIVGSSIKVNGQPAGAVDPTRAAALVSAARTG
ncbi:MAG: BtpA/SgcQ family protein [Longimicrobiales bacterium]